jgi:hypothetical protein
MGEKGFDVVKSKPGSVRKGIVANPHCSRERQELLLADLQMLHHARQGFQARQ